MSKSGYTDTITHGDFEIAWLNDEKTRLSVCYTGEIPSLFEGPDGELVEDPGSVEFPSDKEISKIVGKEVAFFDVGDHCEYVESIYHA